MACAGWLEDREDRTVIHVKLFDLPDAERTDTFSRAEVTAVRRFKETFPERFAEVYRDRYRSDPERYGHHNWDRVEIELHRFSGIKVEGVEADLMAIAAGLAPDVLYVNFRKSDNYIREGFLYPLDLPEDGYLSELSDEAVRLRVHPKFEPVIRRKGPDGQLHTWCMPYGGALGRVLFYRKDLFDAHGVPHPTLEWTWDDLLEASRRLTDPASGTYGILLRRGKHESWYWTTFLWSAGGEVMSYDKAEDRWRCVFDSREAAVALDFYTRLSAERWTDAGGATRRGYSAKDAGDALTKWRQGEIGMYIWYMDELTLYTMNPEVTGMVPVPLGPGGERAAELNSRMMGLSSGIEHPAVRDAAWEYIRFYDSPEAVEVRTRVMVEGGLGRFVNPRHLRMFGYDAIERLAPKGWAETFDIAIESSRPEPYGRNSNLAYDLMTQPLREAEQLALEDRLPEEEAERLAVMQQLLRKGCERANMEMIGVVPPRIRLMRRAAAVLVLLLIVTTFVLAWRRVIRDFTPEETRREGQRAQWDFRRYRWAYLLLAPAVLSIVLWHYVPLLRGSVMAFFDYRLLADSTWVGVDHFGDLLFDGYWWSSVWNAMRYSALILAFTFLPPVLLAVLLQEVPRGKILFRTIYYLPAMTTGLVTVLLWKQFYEPSEFGVLNRVLLRIPAWAFIGMGLLALAVAVHLARRLRVHELRRPAWGFVLGGLLIFLSLSDLASPILLPGGALTLETWTHFPARLFQTLPEPYRWLSDEKSAMMACVLPMAWAGLGPGCLIYLAALKGMPDDLYEAADIDGATFTDKILFVVFPYLKAILLINFIGVFVASWYNATAGILAMTGGAANTEVAGLHIWYKAFTYLKFGPATAMAWMLGFLLIGFTVHQLRILARVEFRTANDEG